MFYFSLRNDYILLHVWFFLNTPKNVVTNKIRLSIFVNRKWRARWFSKYPVHILKIKPFLTQLQQRVHNSARYKTVNVIVPLLKVRSHHNPSGSTKSIVTTYFLVITKCTNRRVLKTNNVPQANHQHAHTVTQARTHTPRTRSSNPL